MGGFRLDRALEFLTSTELVVGLLWSGVAVLAIALVILMQTRWGQSRPLRKCLALSLLAHVLLAGYATTVQIMAGSSPPEEPVMRVTFVEGPAREALGAEDPVAEEKPWEQFPLDAVPPPEPFDTERQPLKKTLEPERHVRAEAANFPGDPPLDHLLIKMPEAKQPEPEPARVTGPTSHLLPDPPSDSLGTHQPGQPSHRGKVTAAKPLPAEAIEAPAPQRRDAAPPALPEPPTPGRRSLVAEPESPPIRSRSTGVPAALLRQPVALPRLAVKPVTPEPASSLAALTDHMTRAARSEPAKLAAGMTDLSHLAADMPPPTAEQGVADLSLREPDRSPIVSQADSQGVERRNPLLPPGETTLVVIPQAPRGQGGRRDLPEIYKLRVAPDRSRLAERVGATPATEAAVKAALKWLADNQSPDGRWDASDHGGGRELLVAGRDRQSAGIEADTGMTGLALLAFLASGHTHRQGTYREHVRRGLEYLLSVQQPNGDLGGRAMQFAKMYCHSMAAFALSEAYGMTADERLRQPVLRAVAYTLAAQEPSTGGWRYKPGDPGDTSQCGWQLMVLKSAELAGIPMPVRTHNGVIRYLRSVASGKHGGLSSYRAGEQISRPMTAEAIVCWQFLGMPREHPAGNEAGDYLLGQLPGEGKANVYYWYYATLAMYQLQGVHWQRWNHALQTTLVESQQKTGLLAGSWAPDTVWGGYGGRVYSTALATLCLEVYYRFLPLYAEGLDHPPRPEGILPLSSSSTHPR